MMPAGHGQFQWDATRNGEELEKRRWMRRRWRRRCWRANKISAIAFTLARIRLNKLRAIGQHPSPSSWWCSAAHSPPTVSHVHSPRPPFAADCATLASNAPPKAMTTLGVIATTAFVKSLNTAVARCTVPLMIDVEQFGAVNVVMRARRCCSRPLRKLLDL